MIGLPPDVELAGGCLGCAAFSVGLAIGGLVAFLLTMIAVWK